MTTKIETIKDFSRRAVMTLLVMMLTMTAQTAWADGAATLQKDGSEYYVNMPTGCAINTLTITEADIAAGKGTFKLYDDGGKNNNYSKYACGTIIISAPEDYIIRVSGTVAMDSRSTFEIYEGATTDDKLFAGTSSTSGTQITTTTSLSSQMRFFFSGATYTYAGLNLTVDIIGTRQTLSIDNSFPPGEVGYYYINMPEKVKGTYNVSTLDLSGDVTTFKIYDDGGKGGSVSQSGKEGNYSNSYKGYIQINVPTGYIIQLTGNICTNTTNNYLTVYNGPTKGSSKLLNQQSSNNMDKWVDIGAILSSGTSILLYFQSDGTEYNRAGFDLTAQLIDVSNTYDITISNAANGSVVKDKDRAESNETVTLTAKPNTGYMLNDIIVTDANGNAVPVSGTLWKTGEQTLTFKMPAAAVNVSPTFRAPNELYVNMPFSGTINRNIPASVTSFKVYDDGGSTKSYTPRADGYLLLTAPENYFLRLSGHVDKIRGDDLLVYNGSTTNCTKLIDDDQIAKGDIPIVTTTGRYMLIRFHSEFDNVSSGLNLTVTLVNGEEERTITVEDATGGSVTANTQSSKAYETIELNISPSENYLLKKLTVTDENSNVYETSGGEWYTNSNTATFSMPASAVIVTPVFTNKWIATDDGLDINMPASGETNASIPSKVQSFKVKYNQSIKKQGVSMLKMTAPEGYLLQLSGSATIERGIGREYLFVYDGDYGTEKLIETSSSVNNTSVVSSGNEMTIYCSSPNNNNVTKWNLDMTVTLVSTNVSNNVAISNSITNGLVVSNKNTAKANEVVTLTTTPDDGYVLQDISVTDENGTISLTPAAADATFGEVNYYAANKFTFKMRSSDATVNATFMPKSDFYVTIPKTGDRTFAIPEGTTSFKVKHYSDMTSGENAGYYYVNYNGYLLLTAPEYFRLKVSGKAYIFPWSSMCDYLEIFDGKTNTSASLGQFWVPSDKTYQTVNAESSGEQLLLYFYADGSGYAKGLDLTVTLIDSRKSLDDLSITIPVQTYSGSALEPTVTVKDGSTILTEGVDYTVAYSNNINASSSAKVIISGKGNYKDEIEKMFTINPASVTLTANSDTKTYNGSTQSVTGFTSSVAGLTFEGVSASGSGNNAGAYDVTFSGVTVNETKDASGNYVVSGLTNGKLTINPAAVTVTADDKEKLSGTDDPEFTATVEGLFGNDAISYTLTREEGEAVGTYTITPAGDGEQGNYTVTYVAGTLTINVNSTPTAITNEAASTVKIFAKRNIIVVENAESAVYVYDVSGHEISSEPTPSDRTEIRVNAAGLYIVKVGKVTKQILVK